MLTIVLSTTCLSAYAGKYDDIINTAVMWPFSKLMNAADSLISNGADDKAMILYLIVASHSDDRISAQERTMCVEAHLRMGEIYYASGNYSNSLKSYFDGLKISDSMPEKPFVAVFYKNIGNTYNELQNYEMGRYMYKIGLKESVAQNDTDTQYKILQNLAAVSILLDEVDVANLYYTEIKGMDVERSAAGHYMEEFILSLILKKEHRYEESVRHFINLAASAKNEKLPAKYECDAYDEIAKIKLETGEVDSAMYYFETCLSLAENASILYRYTDALKSLYMLYDKKGRTDMAQKIKDKYLNIRDSLVNQRQIDKAQNEQFLYEMEKSEKAIAELNEAQRKSESVIEKQRVLLICVFMGIVFVLLLLYYFYWQKKKLSGSYRALYRLNREIVDSYKEQKELQEYVKGVSNLYSEEISSLKKRLLEYGDTHLLAGDSVRPADRKDKAENVASDVEHTDSVSKKYLSSNLRDDQRNKLAEAITGIMENGTQYTSPDFSLAIIADMLDSNVKYVSQVINEVYHKNFNSFVNDYRIRLACERFADVEHYGHYSIKGVGESVGFKSHTTFVNAFKKNTGISPSVYQKLSVEEALNAKSLSESEL